MTDTPPEKSIAERVRALEQRRAEVLGLPPEAALEKILADPEPAALVHAFPESDLYLLVHDIGPQDALPLLALASERQWDHFVDLECWVKDRFEVNGATRWLNLLLEADPRRFIRWFLKDRLEFIELYLFHNLEVRVREHDQDPSELGEGFFTFDQVYYVRFLKLPEMPDGSALGEEERRQFLMKLLERLAEHDHPTYQSVLLEASHVIPAEAEEEEHHWKNVRLAEKGFVPFDEAVGIYQPAARLDLATGPPKAFPEAGPQPGTLPPVPAYPIREVDPQSLFSRALARIEPGIERNPIEWEFANLCNRLVVADRKAVRDREGLRQVVAKACGYLSMGIERALPEGGAGPAAVRAAALLRRHPLERLFRFGFGAAMELKWRVERWTGASWFAKTGLRLTFWGEQWMGVIGGLLIKKPLFYDNYRTGVLYREFAALADIARTEEVLRQVQAVDRLFSLLAPRLKAPGEYGFLTWKNLLLTMWAGRRLGRPANAPEPLALGDFVRFYRELLPGDPPADPAATRPIPDAMKEAFVAWLCEETGLKDFEVSETLGPVFEALFAEIQSEYGRVAAEDLDPRFVPLFLLKAPEAAGRRTGRPP
jgi:hypothetical protein